MRMVRRLAPGPLQTQAIWAVAHTSQARLNLTPQMAQLIIDSWEAAHVLRQSGDSFLQR